VGKKGFVLGVDLKPIVPFPQDYVRTIVADMNEAETIDQILSFLPRKANAVISDASPNISGVWEVDQARQIDLAMKALRIALNVLGKSGHFFVKVFEGKMLSSFVQEVESHFEAVKLFKPKASRAKSSEMFLLAMDLKSANQEKA